MIAACQKAGVQFMDGTMWMHNPRTAAMMAKLQDENVMGKLRTVITTFSAMGGFIPAFIILLRPLHPIQGHL